MTVPDAATRGCGTVIADSAIRHRQRSIKANGVDPSAQTGTRTANALWARVTADRAVIHRQLRFVRIDSSACAPTRVSANRAVGYCHCRVSSGDAAAAKAILISADRAVRYSQRKRSNSMDVDAPHT